ncbi:M24 family metallopeptidase [Nesterenkonia ebinurensis]|uniref:M24 family metallopeptidase n=1 Tax=Nesterenkonia ebinurensis TaxID=2608252 RepID=UPI00123D22C2|nr:aminopeptidase P family protein [Nesterenkonia ebinurensis]
MTAHAGSQSEAGAESIVQQRISRVVEALASSDQEALIVTPSPDFAYLTGIQPPMMERLIALGITAEGVVRLIAPGFEAEDVAPAAAAGLEVISWSDGQDPAAMLLESLRLGSRPQIAVGASTPMRFPLEFMRHRNISWAAGDDILVPLRMRKSAEERALLKAAAAADDETYRLLLGTTELRGRSEQAVQQDLRKHLQETGHDLSRSFSIVAAGANAASPHHRPADTVLREGMGVLTDFGGPRNGYCSDMTRTWSLGPASTHLKEIHTVVLEANQAGLAAVRPGVTAESIDAVVRGVIEDAGYGEYFLHRTGHGIGLEVHEPPYLVAGDTTVLEEGMTFSIEPGIYLPDELGVRIEDIVVVTAEGGESLNKADRSLLEL